MSAATALKPKLIVSAATICWGDAPKNDIAYETKSASYTEVFAPWRDWMREGILDLNCPMTYFSRCQSRRPSGPGWNTFTKDRQYGRQCVHGCRSVPEHRPHLAGLDQRHAAADGAGQQSGGDRAVLLRHAGGVGGQEVEGDTALFAALPTRLFARDVPPPPMSWKTHPKTGALLGMLLAGDGSDAHRRRGGDGGEQENRVRRAASSDGNGGFAFANLPPGSYHLSACMEDGDISADLGCRSPARQHAWTPDTGARQSPPPV